MDDSNTLEEPLNQTTENNEEEADMSSNGSLQNSYSEHVFQNHSSSNQIKINYS